MQMIDVSKVSLAGSPGIAEVKYILWSANGTSVSTTAYTTVNYLQDGSTTLTTSTTASGAKLFTLSSNTPSSLKFALETTIYTNNASYNALSQIYDLTTGGTLIGGGSTASTTATVVRSNQFTLTPSHSYGVGLFPQTNGGTAYLIDASLIIFP